MKIGDTIIEDSFAEAFRVVYSRLLITAYDEHWLNAAVGSVCGYGTSVIGCDAEVGLARFVPPAETPDSRIGAEILLFSFSAESLGKAIVNRVGQCVMTCPTTAAFDNAPTAEMRTALGTQLRFFGDGFQQSKLIGERRIWRIPVMDGEFLVEDEIGIGKGIAGGNFLIHAVDQASGLEALKRGIAAIATLPNVITPFPGGAVRSGSKVGSKYSALRASTNHAYCPSLRGQVDSQIVENANVVYEIVIDGTDEPSVAQAMATGIRATIGPGVVAIGAGNYGGTLGKFHFRLHDVLAKH
ncbi:MAG: formylmethanofuran--tetrahydromethanopterin N-formyltransferase [Pirellulaceae bacterium]